MAHPVMHKSFLQALTLWVTFFHPNCPHTNSFGSAELITQFSYEQISWYTYQTNVANSMHYVGHATRCIELTVDDLVK